MPLITETQVSASYKPLPVPLLGLAVGREIAYNPARNQVLIFNNLTEATITAEIDSTPAAGVFIPGGIGASIDLSTGYSLALPKGLTAVSLKDIARYLTGTTVSVTSSAGPTDLTVGIIS